MTHITYMVDIPGGGRFDEAFRPFAMRNPNSAARLMTRLEQFENHPQAWGESLRGNAKQEVFVVPSCAALDADGDAGFVATVDHTIRGITPTRLIEPHEKPNWDDVKREAEALLGI